MPKSGGTAVGGLASNQQWPLGLVVGPLFATALGAILLWLARQQIVASPVPSEDISIALSVGIGLLFIQFAVMNDRLAQIGTSAVTAAVIALLGWQILGGEGPSFLIALGVVVMLAVLSFLFKEVSPLLMALPLWMLVGTLGLVPLPLLGLGIGLTTLTAIRAGAKPAPTPRRVASREPSGASIKPTVSPQTPTADGSTQAAIAPGAVLFNQLEDKPGPAPELEKEQAFGLADDPAFRLDEDDATATLPVPPRVAPAAPRKDERREEERSAPIGDNFHEVLGEPSRADGALGEMAVMGAPFSSASESDEYKAGNWILQARSSRGASHVHSGEPRQDSYALGRSKDGRFVIAAVADGLGSAERSNFGSYVATRVAVSVLSGQLSQGADVAEVLRSLPQLIAVQMDELARGLIKVDAKSVATTLVVTVVPADQPAPIWLARVGDSDGLVLTRAGRWASGFGGGEGSAIETGTTDVLPHHPDRVEVRTIDGAKAQALLLATDGVARVIEGSPDVVGAAFAERLAEPVDTIDFQRLIDFKRKGAHDDRTVVALWHRPALVSSR